MKTEHDDGTRGERRLKSDQGQGTQRVKPYGQSRLFTFVCLYNIPKKIGNSNEVHMNNSNKTRICLTDYWNIQLERDVICSYTLWNTSVKSHVCYYIFAL